MKLSPRQRVLPALLACLFCAGAQAADEANMFSLSGFATLGVTKTDTDDAHYVISGQPRGATKDGSGDVDSKLGVQLGAKFNPMFSGTVQLLSKQNGNGNFNPEVEWAFLKAQVVPSVSVRLGRMGGPFFAVSDFREVGFANTTLRPPQDVYGQVPVSHFDGADVNYQTSTGLGTVTAQLFGGKASSVVEHIGVDLKKLVGFNVTLETDNGLSLRLGHVTGKLTVKSATLGTLVATLRATPFASVGNEIDATDKTASFSGIGATWDQGDWLLNAEYTQRRTNAYIPDTNGWYVTAGRRIGSWTPYATVSQVSTVSSNVNNTVVAANAQLAVLKGTVDAVVAGQYLSQKTVAIGTRWDFARNFALKAQLDHIRHTGDGYFYRVQPSFGNQTVNVLSIAVDTVF
jgi:hypothetical protein